MGRQNCHPRRRIGITGGGPPGGGCQDHLNPKLGGQRGEPEALSQPVDPGGVGGLFLVEISETVIVIIIIIRFPEMFEHLKIAYFGILVF